MSTRTNGPAAGWHWLWRAVNLGSGNPRAVLGGAALFLAVALVPSVVQLAVQGVAGAGSEGPMLGALAFSLLYSLLVMGPLMAGYLRLLHASETGAPTRPAAIFDIFRAGQGAGRVIGVLLLLVLVGLLLFAAIGALLGGDLFSGLLPVLQALEQAEPGTNPELPPLPDGLGKLFGLLFIVGLFFHGAYAIALGQVALGGRGPGGALADGLMGALRNLLPLLVLGVVMMALGMIAVIVMALVVALLFAVGSLVHPALGMALAVPVYLAAMVAAYVVMFGIAYSMWRDVCGDGGATPGTGQDSVAA